MPLARLLRAMISGRLFATVLTLAFVPVPYSPRVRVPFTGYALQG